MEDFLRFVVERHRIWEQRQLGVPPPWTEDPVLATRKFTNVFRVLDPGTQYVLTDLVDLELSERDQLMRLFLYRHTGQILSWQLANAVLGGYPTVQYLSHLAPVWKEYRARTGTFFTNAYLVYPQSHTPGTDKIDSIIDLAQRLFTPGSPQDVMPAWSKARNQQGRFKVLRANKGVGDFMAMQVLADWSYLQPYNYEDKFLQPGPGSVKGAKALFPNDPVNSTVLRVVKAVRELPNCPRLGYHVPSLMDIGSNLLCEWSKYDRFRRQPVPAKIYTPAHPGPQPEPVLPGYYTEGSDLL